MTAAPKSELEVLQESQGLNIDNYTVKAWTLRQLIEVSPILQGIAHDLQRQGVTLEQLWALFAQEGEGQSWGSALSLVQTLLPSLPRLLSISLNVAEAEVESLEAGETVILAIRVIKANLENLSRFFGQMVTEIQGISKTVSTP